MRSQASTDETVEEIKGSEVALLPRTGRRSSTPAAQMQRFLRAVRPHISRSAAGGMGVWEGGDRLRRGRRARSLLRPRLPETS